jgi:hypothetical protein
MPVDRFLQASEAEAVELPATPVALCRTKTCDMWERSPAEQSKENGVKVAVSPVTTMKETLFDGTVEPIEAVELPETPVALCRTKTGELWDWHQSYGGTHREHPLLRVCPGGEGASVLGLQLPSKAMAWSPPGYVDCESGELDETGGDSSLIGAFTSPWPTDFARCWTVDDGIKAACAGGTVHVCWTVDARKLSGNESHAVSPEFYVQFDPESPTCTFKITIYAAETAHRKRKKTFKHAGGRGFVHLRAVGDVAPSLLFSVSVGAEEKRGPVAHCFSKNAVCCLPMPVEEWDFQGAVDRVKHSFTVNLELAPMPSR